MVLPFIKQRIAKEKNKIIEGEIVGYSTKLKLICIHKLQSFQFSTIIQVRK